VTNHIEISAQSLEPMMAQGFPARVAFLHHLEFARVRLADLSTVRSVRIVETELEPECECRLTGDVADASGCVLHQIAARVQYAQIPEWEANRNVPF
jgi:hypothetical protein